MHEYFSKEDLTFITLVFQLHECTSYMSFYFDFVRWIKQKQRCYLLIYPNIPCQHFLILVNKILFILLLKSYGNIFFLHECNYCIWFSFDIKMFNYNLKNLLFKFSTVSQESRSKKEETIAAHGLTLILRKFKCHVSFFLSFFPISTYSYK